MSWDSNPEPEPVTAHPLMQEEGRDSEVPVSEVLEPGPETVTSSERGSGLGTGGPGFKSLLGSRLTV